MTGNADLDGVFNPKSVAVVGVSASSSRRNMAGTYLRALIQCKFGGPIYPINPKGGEIHGLKIYADVKDTPDSVDYVISCIPAALVPQLVRDCAAKGVKAVQFFTSGFSENGTEEGRRLEAEICNIARQGGIRLIGPNCMGVYCPKAGLSFAPDYPAESGPVAFICQSGGNAIYFIRHAAQRGIRFSKVVSFGNAADVDESDLLEYLTSDTETKIIAAYIEGLKDGRRFSKAVRRAAAAKPVIMMKGGCTEAGARAAASHTGALAGSARIWDGLLRQAGVIPVSTLEELADILVTLLYLPVHHGRRLGVIDVGGGAAVVATDAYVSAGLDLPQLSQELQQKLRSFLSTGAAGLSVNNPVDLGGQFYNTSAAYSVMKTLADYGGIDIFVFHLHLGINPPFPSFPKEFAIAILDNAIRVHNETDKPMVVVIDQLTTVESWETAIACQQKCQQAGIPLYSSVHSAAKALDRFMRYHEKGIG
ncbi:MAG: CoA-binding protein [Chloroflexi bacterium]|nr:CoA-binding protein [Chloroflexota bacterium]